MIHEKNNICLSAVFRVKLFQISEIRGLVLVYESFPK